MALVERLRSACPHPMHRTGEVAQARGDEEVRMVWEITPRVAPQPESQDSALEQCQRSLVVLLVDRHRRASDTANENMVHRTGVIESQRPCHATRFADSHAPAWVRLRQFCTIAATLG